MYLSIYVSIYLCIYLSIYLSSLGTMLPLLSNVNYILITCLSLHITRFFLALHPAPTPSLTHIYHSSVITHSALNPLLNGTPCNIQNISNGGYRVIKEIIWDTL